MSGFSSSSHSYHSAIGGEVEDTSSVCASTITVKEAPAAYGAEGSTVFRKPNDLPGIPEKLQPPVPPKPKLQCQSKDPPCGKVLRS